MQDLFVVVRFDKLEDACFLVVLDDVGDELLFFESVTVVVGHAAGYDDDGLFAAADGLVNGLPGLLVALSGYGTGVDDIDVRRLLKGDYVIAAVFELGGEGIGLILVEPTAECFEGDATGHAVSGFASSPWTQKEVASVI